LINFDMNTSGGGSSPVVSTSLLADGMKSRIQTRLVAFRRRSVGHDQDLQGETGADANQEDEGRWQHRTADHRKAAHSTRRKELGGGGTHLEGKNQGRSIDER
jgi:hypothetical protein